METEKREIVCETEPNLTSNEFTIKVESSYDTKSNTSHSIGMIDLVMTESEALKEACLRKDMFDRQYCFSLKKHLLGFYAYPGLYGRKIIVEIKNANLISTGRFLRALEDKTVDTANPIFRFIFYFDFGNLGYEGHFIPSEWYWLCGDEGKRSVLTL